MIKLHTIGFTQKSAEEFFGILKKAHVATVIDIRLHNDSQLDAIAKKDDLRFSSKSCAVAATSTAPPRCDARRATATWSACTGPCSTSISGCRFSPCLV